MIETIVSIFFYAVIVFLIILVSGHIFKEYYSVKSKEDETHYAITEDGWRLAIHRYRPKGTKQPTSVILCHGLSSNHYTFDLPHGPSLARWLSDRGWDVWVPDLRGSGNSDCIGLFKSDAPLDWSFKDHLELDMPAILSKVLDTTSTDEVHWVGHSMGGMLIRAHMAKKGREGIASAITMGSPVDFSKMGSKKIKWILSLKWVLKSTPVFPLTILAKIFTPVAHQTPRFVVDGHNPANTLPVVSRSIIATASEMYTSNKIWLEFGRYIEQERWGPEDGGQYVEDLLNTPVPTLVIAGSVDHLAPVDAVIPVGSALPKGNIQYKIMEKGANIREHYGHVDLVVGRRVKQEVYPVIEDWMLKNQPKSIDPKEPDVPNI